jgi:citrate lyase subunit beta/citryl-CoA lyase
MTSAHIRPRRSVLYMPGSNARALEKSRTLAADALILDLEDAVAPDAKPEARALVAAALSQGGFGKRELIVRVNALDTEWGMADIAMTLKAKPHAVLVPKITSAADVARAEDALKAAPAEMALWCMIETPLALLNIREIAAKSGEPRSRLRGFVMGTNDLAKELLAAHTPDRAPMLASLGLALLGARAYGLAALDGVHNDIKDEKGFELACMQGRDMGFDGKTLLHPSQIETCNRIFSPSPETVAFSRKVIAAFDLPENAAKAVLTVDGKMVELLHAESARRIVAVADAIAAM